MTRKYIIRRYNQMLNKWQFLYIYPNGKDHWVDNTPATAHRFMTEGEAALCLNHGEKELNWTGTHVIEPIYE